jgi:peptidoglycan hydrolase CwlO-like protein
MLTVKQHERLIDKIKTLSEIELDGLLKDIVEHLQNNKLNHLLFSAYGLEDLSDEVDELQERVSELEEERDELKDTIDQIKAII